MLVYQRVNDTSTSLWDSPNAMKRENLEMGFGDGVYQPYKNPFLVEKGGSYGRVYHWVYHSNN